jgi:hypothetical protein
MKILTNYFNYKGRKMNTKNIKQLEESQNTTATNWKATVLTGISNGCVNTEDSIPSASIMGNFTKENASNFVQELADAMSINIRLNRIESWYASEDSVIYIMYDIEPSNIVDNVPVIANPNLDDKYGIKITPQLGKKLKM